MPGLIQRHNPVAEYSAPLYTSPTADHGERRRRHHHDCQEGPLASTSPRSRSPRAALRDEASEWYDAIVPPLEDVQAFLRRMQADPDLTQDRVFAHLWPAVMLCALLTVVLVAVREDSYVNRMLDSPSLDGWWVVAARFAGLAVCWVVLSVVALKCVIFCVAGACAIVAATETREEMRAREERGIPTSGLVFSGMLM